MILMCAGKGTHEGELGMKHDGRKQIGSEEAREERGQQRAQRPAPGKVTRTSKLDAGRQPVQRKVQAPGTAGSATPVKSLWELTMDPWMDAAHRGMAGFGGKAAGKAGADEDKKVDTEGGDSAVTTGPVAGGLDVASGPVTGGVETSGDLENGPGSAPREAEAEGAVGGPTGVDMLGGGESKQVAQTETIPTGPAYSPAAITPNFILDKKLSARSNTKPSTQSASDPTFVGETAVDTAGKTWRYQLKSVESRGKIRIVYFTKDHYPAPTPTDDSGALSNVKSDNWRDIVEDLDKNKAGVPDFWSAYRREDVHELYHWDVEWQGEVKKELIKAGADIAKLSLGFDKADTVAKANAILAPQAAKIFKGAMASARAAYNALGDSPGDPPYQAQVPAVEALIKRVQDHATSKGWS
jgi:hypothetical protein